MRRPLVDRIIDHSSNRNFETRGFGQETNPARISRFLIYDRIVDDEGKEHDQSDNKSDLKDDRPNFGSYHQRAPPPEGVPPSFTPPPCQFPCISIRRAVVFFSKTQRPARINRTAGRISIQLSLPARRSTERRSVNYARWSKVVDATVEANRGLRTDMALINLAIIADRFYPL